MRCSGEHVHGEGGGGGVAEGAEAGDVAGEGGGVAGDVDQAVGLHGGDGLQGWGVHALAGRVHDYGVGRYAAGFELPRGLAGVGDPGGLGLADFDMVASEAKLFLEDEGWC